MASPAAEGVEPKDSECSVCNEQFTEPKLLPCGHLLCRHCLLTWMKTQDEARCPLCRDLIVGTKEQPLQSLEEVVSGFPTELSMELILQADRILSKQHSCCVCEDVAATSMCLNCKDMLCASCKKAHGKLSFLKHHVVEDLSSLTAEKVAASHSSPCSTHPEEIPKLFCPTHGASICLLCATSKHRSCPEVKDLGEKMEESQELLKQQRTTLLDGEAQFNKAIDELDQHLQDVQKYADAAIVKIQEMCDALDALVKENRQRLKEQVLSARRSIEKAVKEGRSCLLQRQTKLSTHRQTVQRVTEAKNREVVTTMALKMQQRVSDLNYSTVLPGDAEIISTFTFIKNETALTQIKQKMGKLGEIKMVEATVAANKRFVFHDNHGTSVTLSNGNRTASKSWDALDGIVLSKIPLQVNSLYEVKIDKWVSGRPVRTGLNSLAVGVTNQAPASIMLPAWSNKLGCSARISARQGRVGSALQSLGEQRRVGLALDSARSLHLYVDGQDKGAFATNMPDPCYAVFDVVDQYEQITALPVTTVQ